MNDISKEQATLITDLDSYKTVTGAKRFKRTKEEMTAGFTPTEALNKRLIEVRGETVIGDSHTVGGRTDAPIEKDGDPRFGRSYRKSNITIQVRAAPKTDADFFEHIPAKPVEIILDQSWYSWFDTLAAGPFQGDSTKLLRFILEQGIGQVLTAIHFPSDIEDIERPVRTPEEVV